ncbi:MAG: DUF1801 domain-containing protein [Myxococcota bacterium]
MARSKKKKKTQAKSRPAKRRAAAKKVAKKSLKKAATKRSARKGSAPKAVKRAAKKPAKKAGGKRPGLTGKNAATFNRAAARAEVEGLLARLPPPVAPIVKTLRKLVMEAAPEAVERLEGGVPAYFAGGMFARIEPHERDVLVKFIHGAELPSSAVLQTNGEEGSATLSSLDSVREAVLRTLVREAVLLNLSKSPARPDAPAMPVPEGQALA